MLESGMGDVRMMDQGRTVRMIERLVFEADRDGAGPLIQERRGSAPDILAAFLVTRFLLYTVSVP